MESRDTLALNFTLATAVAVVLNLHPHPSCGCLAKQATWTLLPLKPSLPFVDTLGSREVVQLWNPGGKAKDAKGLSTPQTGSLASDRAEGMACRVKAAATRRKLPATSRQSLSSLTGNLEPPDPILVGWTSCFLYKVRVEHANLLNL